MTAPAPSPAEQAVIDRFGIFAEERVVEEVVRRVEALHVPLVNNATREPACPDCLGGIYAENPEEVRPCGCWGFSTPVCSSCADYSGGRRYALQWPCPTIAALAPQAGEAGQ